MKPYTNPSIIILSVDADIICTSTLAVDPSTRNSGGIRAPHRNIWD